LNGLGGAGAAPRAGLVGYNFLENQSSANEADAMTRNAAAVFVSNNSWGPFDNGRWAASAATWRAAIDTGLSTGRNGLGTIYTFAAGNGGLVSDNSNYDGYANYRGVLSICAVGDDGVKASYSERGANLWVCAPSRGRANHAITTTDRTGALGYNTGAAPDYTNANYTNTFNGTSAAAPLAAGVIALVLEARPTLTWRDVRIILAESARRNHLADIDWTMNAAGFNINHNYGFGVIDANAAVTRARTWVNVGAQVTFATATAAVNAAIPDNNMTGVSNTINVAGSGIGKIEFVHITFNGTHTDVGDLDITLTAPSSTVSRLSEVHACAGGCLGVPGNSWRFGSARHLGEAADGNWTLTVRDLAAVDTGIFTSWQITFYGRLN
jgi:kexin